MDMKLIYHSGVHFVLDFYDKGDCLWMMRTIVDIFINWIVIVLQNYKPEFIFV
jgi:hypothetical protein